MMRVETFSHSQGRARLAVVVLLALGALAIIFLMRRPEGSSRPNDEPRPPASTSPSLANSTRLLDELIPEWTRQIRASVVLNHPEIREADVLRELVSLLRARSTSASLRDHEACSLITPDATSAELASLPSIHALLTEVGKNTSIPLDSLDPMLLVRDLRQDHTFVKEDGTDSETGWPVEPSTGGPFEVVLMRRRLRERIDDLATVANAAIESNLTLNNPEKFPILSWANSLESVRLMDLQREPEPGTLPFFSVADRTAAREVSARWPTVALAGSPPQQFARKPAFSPFDRTSGAMFDELVALQSDLDREVATWAKLTNRDPSSIVGLVRAIRSLIDQEKDRELRVGRPGWRSLNAR